MTPDFQECLRFVLKWEGSRFTNHPADRGGPTRYGITQRVYDAWRRQRKLPLRSVKDITLNEVETIYWERYWQPALCDRLPHKALRLVHFDCAVNCGVSRALQFLQEGIAAMGVPLPKTKNWKEVLAEALSKIDATQLSDWLIARRERFYRAIVKNNPTQKVFLKGWLNRTADLRKEAKRLLEETQQGGQDAK